MGKNGVETILYILKGFEENIEMERKNIETAQTKIQELSRLIASTVSICLDLQKIPRKKILVNSGETPPSVHNPDEWKDLKKKPVEAYIVCGLNYLPKEWEKYSHITFVNKKIVFKSDAGQEHVIPEAWYGSIGIFINPTFVIQYVCENKKLLEQFYKG